MIETNSPILASTKINFVKAALIVALCSLVFWVGKSMFSSMLSIRPATSIVLWEQNKEPILPELAVSYIDRLKLSVAIDPNNAKSHFLLASLYELLAFEKNVAANDTYILNAQQSYQNAVFHQPSWDIAWARLATLHSKLNNNKEAINALEQALVLGPYEYQNQRLIIPIIIKYWNTDTFVKKNNSAIRKLFSHALNFKKIILGC